MLGMYNSEQDRIPDFPEHREGPGFSTPEGDTPAGEAGGQRQTLLWRKHQG